MLTHYTFKNAGYVPQWGLCTSTHVQLLFPIHTYKVFSGTIISSVIPNGDIKRTAEWQLLLATIALPGTSMTGFDTSAFELLMINRRLHRGRIMQSAWTSQHSTCN